MSRHNRARRNKWKCAGCGAGMHRELSSPTARLVAAAARGAPGPADPKAVVHVCGLCKTFHYPEGDGLRKLTPAEMFELHFEHPNTTSAVLAQVCPPSDTPAGTLFLSLEDRT